MLTLVVVYLGWIFRGYELCEVSVQQGLDVDLDTYVAKGMYGVEMADSKK